MDFWQNIGVGIGLLAAVAVVFGALYKQLHRRTKSEIAITEEMQRAAYEALPKCVCGDVAKFPAPVLQRSRGAWDWLRSHFAAPPRYKRVVDLMQPPVFCSAHAHVADATMDQFIFGIRSEYSKLNARVAADAAGFEQEALMRLVADSLTDLQKRTVRKLNVPTIRVLPAAKTGTDDTGSVDGSQ